MARQISTKKNIKKARRWSVRLHGPKPDPISRPRAKYNQESLAKAVAEFKSGTALRKCASIYEIPMMTIHRHATQVNIGPIGRPTLLPNEAEALIARILSTMSEWGFGLTQLQVRSVASDYLASVGDNRIVGRMWFEGFMKRYSDIISLRKSTNLASNRATAITKACIDDFFAMLKKQFDKYNLALKPHSIWNVDESGYHCDQGNHKIVCRKGLYNPLRLQGFKILNCNLNNFIF